MKTNNESMGKNIFRQGYFNEYITRCMNKNKYTDSEKCSSICIRVEPFI